MAILSSYVSLLPPILNQKYSNDFWVGAANDLLEVLSSEGILRELKYLRGVIVKNNKWITPPSNYRQAIKLTDPLDEQTEYPFQETDDKLMLIRGTLQEDDDPYEISAFTAQATDSITVDLTGFDEDDLKNYLLVITAGTAINNTYVISGNDASGDTTTKIYFDLALSSALTGAQATAGELVRPQYYMSLLYRGSFSELSAVSEEVPIKNNYERRIVRTWLMFYGYERLHGPNADMTKLWEGKFERVLQKLRDEFLRLGTKNTALPRRWPGLVDDEDLSDNLDDDD